MRKLKEKHISPDGNLELAITIDEDGGLIVGFLSPGSGEPSFYGHIHPEMFVTNEGLSTEEYASRVVNRTLEDKEVIVLFHRNGELVDINWTDDPLLDLEDLEEGEKVEFRDWSGKRQ